MEEKKRIYLDSAAALTVEIDRMKDEVRVINVRIAQCIWHRQQLLEEVS